MSMSMSTLSSSCQNYNIITNNISQWFWAWQHKEKCQYGMVSHVYQNREDNVEYATQHIMNIRSTKMCLPDKDIVYDLPTSISITAPIPSLG